MKKKIILVLFIFHFNCLTLVGIKIGNAIDGKSESAEAKIQATALVGLLGDFYAASLIQPTPFGLAYGVLAGIFYLVTDGGISDRYGRNLEQE